MGRVLAALGTLLVVGFFAVGAFVIFSIGESDYTGSFDLSGVTTYEPCLKAPGGCPCLRDRDCPDRLESFREHPVFWLGEEFGGLPLTSVDFADYGERHGQRIREVRLTYGTCVIPAGQEGCGIPLTISISRFCESSVDLEVIEEDLSRSELRGTRAYTSNAGNVLMWIRTSNVVIDIRGTTNLGGAGHVADNLVRANGGWPTSPGEAFEPPTDDCHPGGPTASPFPR